MKYLNCRNEVVPWATVFNPDAVYPDYLTDWNVLICPSAMGGSNAIENWDQGESLSPRVADQIKLGHPYYNNGIVEGCEVFEHPYVYLGWVIDDYALEMEVAAQGDLSRLRLAAQQFGQEIRNNPGAVNGSWKLDEPIGGRDEFFRLRLGVDRFLTTNIDDPKLGTVPDTQLAVMWDVISGQDVSHFNHAPGGCNVLYMDGHVDFVRFRGLGASPFPVNQGGLIFYELAQE